MERVQFQQEQMLAELKDLVQKSLFTQKEVKQIMQKRTAFETALVRRIPKKSDFLRYATYEMSLEALRRKRVERLKLPKGPPSVSDYALVRRQFQIFERALKKFKGDVGLWIQYIQVAKKEGARALVGRITARALQLHPNVPALYVLAASHELEHLSPSAARALLQRGIRLNSDSVEMWREYVKMELNFVESLRRRWSVLGIDTKGKGKDAIKVKGKQTNVADDLGASGLEDEIQGDHDSMDVDLQEEAVDEDEAARKQIMDGAIVKAVISNAVQAIPKIELFISIQELISRYPSPLSLRETLLDHLHALLRNTLPSLPAAIKLAATRAFTADLPGVQLVDASRNANNVLSEAVRTSSAEAREGMARVYVEFIDELIRKTADDSLRFYSSALSAFARHKAFLISSLHLLIQQLPSPTPAALLAAHVRLLLRHHALLGSALLPPKVNSPEKILHVSRKYTSQAPSSAAVWLARLDAEKQFAQPEDVDRAWRSARENVLGDEQEDVWLWGLRPEDVQRSPASEDSQSPSRSGPRTVTQADDNAREGQGQVVRDDPDVALLELLLPESKRIWSPAAASAIHEVLLMRYAAATHRALLQRCCPLEVYQRSQHGNDDDDDDDDGQQQQQAHRPQQIHNTDQTPRGTRHASTSTPHAGGSTSGSAGQPRDRAPQQQQQQDLATHREQLAGPPAPTTTTTTRAGPAAALAHPATVEARLTRVRRLAAAYTPSPRVWAEVFRQEAEWPRGDGGVLGAVYEFWRQGDGVGATAAWAAWLLRSGRGADALAVVGRARSVLGEEAGEEVERRWKAILDGRGGEEEDADADVTGLTDEERSL
ncbi:U3 small nucleolar RNA-associated protein 6-domain-containing protein [Trametes gibbosa]|nr:U3 small nucleolar RNA-associated protein 6-domain-containing protein [Trametes gibbosa]